MRRETTWLRLAWTVAAKRAALPGRTRPRPDGIRIQVYMAIIACMLIVLWTGRKPTLRTVEMIQFYFVGWAEQDELEAHIAGLKPVEV